MNLNDPQNWSFPVPIAYGPGRLNEIAQFCDKAGIQKPLIVTDRNSQDLPFVGQLSQCLSVAGIQHSRFSAISPNPRDDEIADGCEQFRSDMHDGIIGIGGGSSMDGAKAIGLTARSGITLWDFEYESPSPSVNAPEAFPPLITIPTTAGTGAETESTAMITDTGRRMKFCIWHETYKPRLALLDPALTTGLPPHLTAWTGIDALVHAIEAYCVPGFHPLCDGAALQAMRLISTSLDRAFKEPDNLEARGAMLVGSCLAGIAFLKGLGLVHAISHMVGAEYDTQHGLTNAILLPAALRHNRPAIGQHIEPMAQALGLNDTSFASFDFHICQWLDNLVIPKNLKDLNIPTDCATRIAEKAIQDSAAGTNPRPLTVEDIAQVVEAALNSGR